MIAEKSELKEQFLGGFTPSTLLPAPQVQEALETLAGLQFPAGKDEYWKYTRPTKIINSRFSAIADSSRIDLNPFLIPGLDAYRVVFVNGFFRSDLSEISSLEDGLLIRERSSAPEDMVINTAFTYSNDIFNTINAAYAIGGLEIRSHRGAQISKPVHIIHIQAADDCIAQPRHLVIAEESSSLKVIQSFKSLVTGRTFTNIVNEIFVRRNARLEYNKLQYEQEEGLQISNDYAYQEQDSCLSCNTITLNGALVRNNLNVVIDGENCESRLYGLYALSGHQHVDNHTLVDHRKPNSNSNELYKGIIDGNGIGVFNGKVYVREQAQKTNAFQQNNNVLLSDSAVMNTKPELEIYADDVKCSHGCTVGQFDEEAVFYLRSRGIGEERARNLLVYAFAGEVLENLSLKPLKKFVHELIARRFNWEEL